MMDSMMLFQSDHRNVGKRSFVRDSENHGCKKPKKERKPRFAHETSRLNRTAHTETYKLGISKKNNAEFREKSVYNIIIMLY